MTTVTNTATLAGITYSKSSTTTETDTVTNVLDTTVSTSAYGEAIPLLYGTMALSCNVIWTTGVQEVIKTTTVTTVTTSVTAGQYFDWSDI